MCRPLIEKRFAARPWLRTTNVTVAPAGAERRLIVNDASRATTRTVTGACARDTAEPASTAATPPTSASASQRPGRGRTTPTG